jgi:uncharacterized protein YegP (UPF0339 family)
MNSQHAQRMNANFTQTGESMERLPTASRGDPRPSHEGCCQFHIYRTERVNLTSTLFGGGDWHWRLTGSSGAIIADCGGYRNEAQCLAAVQALRADAAAAKLVKHAEITDFPLNASMN